MKKNTAKGFTLMELVIVMIIIGVVAAISGKIIMSGFLGFQYSADLVDADSQARLAMERMQRDIRAIRSPSDISTATASSLVFTDTSNNQISYSLSSGSLMRQTNSNTIQQLANGIASLTFTYYDRNGATTSTLANIRYISFSLNVTQGGANFTVTSAVYPRNLP